AFLLLKYYNFKSLNNFETRFKNVSFFIHGGKDAFDHYKEITSTRTAMEYLDSVLGDRAYYHLLLLFSAIFTLAYLGMIEIFFPVLESIRVDVLSTIAGFFDGLIASHLIEKRWIIRFQFNENRNEYIRKN
ncbi:MAG: hypothetical protein ACFFD4_28665, partial [Candidatus Odinarchaeota archaeon]